MLTAHANDLLTDQQIKQASSIIKEAQQHHVSTYICVGTSINESKNCLMLAKAYSSIFATVGIHPTDATDTWQRECSTLLSWAKEKESLRIVGIGECGIDRFHAGYNRQRQADLFQTQIDIALEYDLALVVHSRDAYDETLNILIKYKGQLARGVIHCFSYDQTFANEAIALGFYIGLGGTITYPKNHVLRQVAQNIPLDRIVLETDAPFLPPQEIRGKQNHPKQIAAIARYLAQLRNSSFEQIAQQTTQNAEKLFAIDQK